MNFSWKTLWPSSIWLWLIFHQPTTANGQSPGLPCQQNLVVNGNFENGDPFKKNHASTDFSNGCTNSEGIEGHYCYSDNMNSKYGFRSGTDHTSNDGTGFMLVFDGFKDNKNSKKTLWQQEITLSGTESYTFSCWLQNRWVNGSKMDQATIELYVNNTFKDSYTLKAEKGWHQFESTISKMNGKTTIALIQPENPNGDLSEDFALDDISLCKNVSTGLNKKTPAEEWVIYPNPTQHFLNLDNHGLSSTPIQWHISSPSGQVLMKGNAAKNTSIRISLENLENGMYFIIIRDGETKSVKPFVKS